MELPPVAIMMDIHREVDWDYINEGVKNGSIMCTGYYIDDGRLYYKHILTSTPPNAV